MNKDQIITALLGLFGLSGPLAGILARVLHMSNATVQDVLNIATILTPIVVGGVFTWWQRNTAKVEGVASMSSAEQHEALNKVSDVAKIQIAEAVKDVATVVVKDTANGALAALAQSDAHPNIVTETQNEKDAKEGTKT